MKKTTRSREENWEVSVKGRVGFVVITLTLTAALAQALSGKKLDK
jgi:hypothetical protein